MSGVSSKTKQNQLTSVQIKHVQTKFITLRWLCRFVFWSKFGAFIRNFVWYCSGEFGPLFNLTKSSQNLHFHSLCRRDFQWPNLLLVWQVFVGFQDEIIRNSKFFMFSSGFPFAGTWRAKASVEVHKLSINGNLEIWTHLSMEVEQMTMNHPKMRLTCQNDMAMSNSTIPGAHDKQNSL